ncbi:octapeptide-repeat protein T2-like [Equus przewalskii]|uniref:Octapeptide-repeat protein T2-like n=1 Tax=Equus przewalskii TaxID=9798 RepID=A0ABM4KWB8_EQUPR
MAGEDQGDSHPHLSQSQVPGSTQPGGRRPLSGRAALGPAGRRRGVPEEAEFWAAGDASGSAERDEGAEGEAGGTLKGRGGADGPGAPRDVRRSLRAAAGRAGGDGPEGAGRGGAGGARPPTSSLAWLRNAHMRSSGLARKAGATCRGDRADHREREETASREERRAGPQGQGRRRWGQKGARVARERGTGQGNARPGRRPGQAEMPRARRLRGRAATKRGQVYCRERERGGRLRD